MTAAFPSLKRFLLSVMLAAGVTASGRSAVLDLETVNGATPFEGLVISNQFEPYYGMSFRRSDGRFPSIARQGFPGAAFELGSVTPISYDRLHPNNPMIGNFGAYFLNDDSIIEEKTTIYIDFTTPVSEVSAYVFDIEDAEEFVVVVYSDFGTTAIATNTITGSHPDAGDGSSILWSISRATNDIRHVRFRLNSTSTGWGLDNISSNYSPPPAQAATLVTNLYAGIKISGEIGRPYLIEYAEQLSPSNWVALTNLYLQSSNTTLIDAGSTNREKRFYRARSLSGPGATLTFETINGFVPGEGRGVSNQFEINFGMRFRRNDGGVPQIARRGLPAVAYGAAFDTPFGSDSINPLDPRAGEFGDLFLNDDGSMNSIRTIFIDFAQPVAQASGFVLDLDSNEELTINVYSDFGTNLIDSLVIASGDPGTGDGRAAPWAFNRATNDIRQIRLRQSSSGNFNVGYDNLSSSYVPPPQQTATLEIYQFAGLTVTGEVGRPYAIEFAEQTAPATWVLLTNTFLPVSPLLIIDTTSTNSARRAYRATSLP